ncbi:Maf-like protein [Deltaproteobacteria bacterium]|nr:Maf-like protein [Deltaproteobacteria bacterium]
MPERIDIAPGEAGIIPLFTLVPGLRLILASASPRRRQFLHEWGLPFTSVWPKGVEPRPEHDETPDAYCRRAAAAKALAVARQTAGDEILILAADTVVALHGDILGKPRDAQEALGMLQRLSGQSHEVISAVCLLLPDGRRRVFSDASRVFFHAWPTSVLAAYVRTHESDDKAGGYAVQGQGAFLVERVEGSWSTVVGLPTTMLARTMLDEGIISPVSNGA